MSQIVEKDGKRFLLDEYGLIPEANANPCWWGPMPFANPLINRETGEPYKFYIWRAEGVQPYREFDAKAERGEVVRDEPA